MTSPSSAATITLAPVTEAGFAALRDLAGTIWRQHYPGIIPEAQIDSMLAGRFSDAALRDQAQAADRWLEVLSVAGEPVGYCGSELAESPGAGGPAMKLAQLYVLKSHRQRGLGGFMLGRVEDRAGDLGRRTVFLQVNRRNAGAIGFYEAAGFTVVREAVFDIGSGFVMDDFIMEKRL